MARGGAILLGLPLSSVLSPSLRREERKNQHQVFATISTTMNFRERALARFPAGSNGEYGIPAELIPVLQRGAGCRVWDTEGREFLDLTMAWGAALVGHAHPKIIEAATRQARDGANFAAVNARAVELAERLHALSPCAEKIQIGRAHV